MNVTCIICSDTITQSSEVYTTQCGHLFHYHCLIQWIERSKTCPQCRNKTTEKTINRVYFNFANTDHIVDDVVTLQNKIDNLNFQITLKDKDIRGFREKYKKVKNQNVALREEVSGLEAKARIHDSVVHALKDQITFFKSKSKEQDRLTEEVSKLKNKLKEMESVQLAMHGTREEVNDMLRTENNVESLVILAATLKKALLDTEKKKLNADHKLKQLQYDVAKYRRDIASLESSNKELRKELESSKTNWGHEKEFLTNLVLDTHQSGDKNKPNIKRLMLESPVPLPQKKLKSNDIINLDAEDSPSVEKKVIEILDSDSPYLPVKTSSMGINFESLPKTKFTQISSHKMSIFKKPGNRLEPNVRPSGTSEGDEVVYNGLGGQGKKDLFPSPKTSIVGIKRHRINPTTSVLKIRKSASPISFKKQ